MQVRRLEINVNQSNNQSTHELRKKKKKKKTECFSYVSQPYDGPHSAAWLVHVGVCACV